MLKNLSLALSVIGFIVGLVASYYWLRASEVRIVPAWDLEFPRDALAKTPNLSAGDVVDKNIMGWTTGVMIAFKKSGDLNRTAAIWTAAAVALSSGASLLSGLI